MTMVDCQTEQCNTIDSCKLLSTGDMKMDFHVCFQKVDRVLVDAFANQLQALRSPYIAVGYNLEAFVVEVDPALRVNTQSPVFRNRPFVVRRDLPASSVSLLQLPSRRCLTHSLRSVRERWGPFVESERVMRVHTRAKAVQVHRCRIESF